MKNKIVIFGGSFNPPLNSHFSIAQQVLNDCEEVEKIVFVPVNLIYSKKGLIANEDRMEMLRLVIEKNDGFSLSDIDMHSDHSLYMIEILKAMQEEYPDKEICFLVGSDNYKELSHWRNAEELLSTYPVFVMERGKDEAKQIMEQDEILKRYQNNLIVLHEGIRSNYSSTYVRHQLRVGKSVRYLLPEEVYEYIEKKNLYRTEESD